MSTPASLLHSAHAEKHGLPLASLESSPAWKAELNARLREHRQRRGEQSSAAEDTGLQGYRRAPEQTAPSSKVAARVAERYNNAPSYQDLLAVSAAAAAVAADKAATAAQAARHAAEAVLASCEQQEISFASAEVSADQPLEACGTADVEAAPVQPAYVEHHAPLPQRASVPERSPIAERARSLVDAFAEAVVPAAQSLPAKLIEFPRELIAPRRQRPRLAEGPLFEEQSTGSALRIFEVGLHASQPSGDALATGSMMVEEPFFTDNDRDFVAVSYGMVMNQSDGQNEEQPSRRRGSFHADPEPEAAPVPSGRRAQPVRQESGWGSIRLGEHPQAQAESEQVAQAARRQEHGYKPETAPALHDLAPITDRLMAALIDGGIVLGCFLLSVLVFAACTVHPPAGKAALAISLLVFGVMATFYGWLFMTYGGGSTPGMRYARIALCTFADDNPKRKDLQNRVPATALALLPLGLGVFWALLDEDKLGWHDRMTRTYQRSYRG